MDEIFEVDATAVLCKVPKTAVTHWRDGENHKKGKWAEKLTINPKWNAKALAQLYNLLLGQRFAANDSFS